MYSVDRVLSGKYKRAVAALTAQTPKRGKAASPIALSAPRRRGPSPRDTLHAINLGYSTGEIVELRRRGLIAW